MNPAILIEMPCKTTEGFTLRVLACVLFLLSSVSGFSQGKGKAAERQKPVAAASKSEEISNKPACNYSKNLEDKTKGTYVKMMERELLIKHTPDEMTELFPDSDFLLAEAYLNNFNGTIALLLKITLQTNSPTDTYGSIYKEGKLLLKLSTGETITLYSGQSDAGNIDRAHSRTTYMTFFSLDEATLEKLKTAEVTKARLFWAKGYEDYKISIPDFFIRQIGCVK